MERKDCRSLKEIQSYHTRMRRNICETPGSKGERSEERTSLILVCGHCKKGKGRNCLRRDNKNILYG